MAIKARIITEDLTVLADFIAGPWQLIDRAYDPNTETETLKLLGVSPKNPAVPSEASEQLLGDVVNYIKLHQELPNIYNPPFWEYETGSTIDDGRRKAVLDAEISRETENISSSFNTDSHSYIILVLTCDPKREKTNLNAFSGTDIDLAFDSFTYLVSSSNAPARIREAVITSTDLALPAPPIYKNLARVINIGLKPSTYDMTNFKAIWETEGAFAFLSGATIVADAGASGGSTLQSRLLTVGGATARDARYELANVAFGQPHEVYIGDYTIFLRYKFINAGPVPGDIGQALITTFATDNQSNGGEILEPINFGQWHMQPIANITIGNKGINDTNLELIWSLEFWLEKLTGNDIHLRMDCIVLVPQPYSLSVTLPTIFKVKAEYRQLTNGLSVVRSFGQPPDPEIHVGEVTSDENFILQARSGLAVVVTHQTDYSAPNISSLGDVEIKYHRTFSNWGP